MGIIFFIIIIIPVAHSTCAKGLDEKSICKGSEKELLLPPLPPAKKQKILRNFRPPSNKCLTPNNSQKRALSVISKFVGSERGATTPRLQVWWREIDALQYTRKWNTERIVVRMR